MVRLAVVLTVLGCDAGAPPKAPKPSVVIDVIAARWQCFIKHPRNVETDDLQVPAGQTVMVRFSTPERFDGRDKLAATIGGITKRVRQNKPAEITFQIDKPGTYKWKCPTASEQTLQVVPPAEYEAFLAANNPDDPKNALAVGKKLFVTMGCVSCHTTDGTAKVGPSWKGIWGTTVMLQDGTTRVVDEEYVRRSILEPTAFARPLYSPVMPSFEGRLRENELAALVAYIKSLRE